MVFVKVLIIFGLFFVIMVKMRWFCMVVYLFVGMMFFIWWYLRVEKISDD